MNYAHILNLLGFALNVLGAAVGSASLVNTWRTYSREPLSPGLARAIESLRSILGMKRDVHVKAEAAGMGGTATLVHAVVREGFPDGLSIDEKLARLIRGYKGLGDEIDANRQGAESSNHAISDRLVKLDERWSRDHARLKAMAR